MSTTDPLHGFDVRDYDAKTGKVTIAVSALALRRWRTQMRMDERAREIIAFGVGITHVHWVPRE